MAFLEESHSNEIKLLLAAAQPIVTDGKSQWDEFAQQLQFDWEALLREAGRHGLQPLLSRFLKSAAPIAVPPGRLEQLQQTQQDTTLRNLRLAGELWALLELFAAHGIEALPIKGPTLAMLAFADLAGRQFADLDLLIAEQDLARTAELLVARGYEPWIELGAVYDEAFRRITNVLEFSHPEKNILVEVHWRLSAGLLPLDLTEAWRERRLVQTAPGGKPMHTFAPEPLLVYLCVHATKHCWGRIAWAADIAWLIRQQPEFDWKYLLSLTHAQGCRRSVRLGLLLASDFLGAGLPSIVRDEIEADSVVKELAQRVAYWWTLPGDKAPSPESGMVERNRFFFAVQDDWQSRLRYVGRLLLTPNLNDWKFVRLPVQLIYLYVLLRPLRFLLGLLTSPVNHRDAR